MNAKNAKDYLPFVQALAEGKVIQIKTGCGWQDLENVSFGDIPSEYRIKPEPREIWVNDYDQDSVVHYSKKDAEDNCARGGVTRRYREVIE